jgi:uncharacterized protein (DUF1015 family)
MATIKPFSAIRPVALPLELEVLKHRLEPHWHGLGSPSYADCRDFLTSMLDSESYAQEEEAIYIYGYETASGQSRIGVWALSSLEDHVAGKIVPHEDTLTSVEEQIYRYRREVGLEGSAVVLCYPASAAIDQLIDISRGDTLERRFRYGELVHRLWVVTHPYQVDGFKRAFASLSRVYVADGHHRLAAAARMHKGSAQWISSLYFSFEQVDISAFHRLVRAADVNRHQFTRGLAQYYRLGNVPYNQPYRPSEKGKMGLFFSGIWYELSTRAEVQELFDLPDAKLLQERIFSRVLGITDPASDARLEYYNNVSGWEQLLLEINKDSSVIVFTLYPMKASELMDVADLGFPLPPKSTFISPKAPFGVLMRDGKNESSGSQGGEG